MSDEPEPENTSDEPEKDRLGETGPENTGPGDVFDRMAIADTPTPIDEDPLGTLKERDGLLLTRVRVVRGHGIWAYWASRDALEVIADMSFSPQAAHFAGKLTATFVSSEPQEVWMVVQGWLEPLPERRVYWEDEDAGLPRMEKR